MIDLFALLELYNTYSQSDLSFDIAKAILEQYGALELGSLNDFADSLHVSPSSMNRFFKLLYYDNFSVFKAEHLKHNEYYCLDHARSAPLAATSFHQYGADFLARLGAVMSTVEEAAVERLYRYMLDYPNIVFVGMPMPSEVWWLQVELVLLGKRTSAFLAPNNQVQAVLSAGPDTLLVGLDVVRQDDIFLQRTMEEGGARGAACACISHFPQPGATAVPADLFVCYGGTNSHMDQLGLAMLLNYLGQRLRQRLFEGKRPSEPAL